MGKTFVGFGFGPIQSALFLFEAYRSGNFSRFVVAEVDAALVRAVRQSGAYVVNIASERGIEQAEVRGVELLNPNVAEDRERLIDAIADADELATALPSVNFYDRGDASVALLLAKGLARRAPGRPGVIYTAENHNHAAELLAEAVGRFGTLGAVQPLNTVVGKMSGVIGNPDEIGRLSLRTLTPSTARAVLVESFNRILVSSVTVPYQRSIPVFVEKPDLLPFEEAKLYGHNAIHALIGYLAARRGLTAMSQAADHPDLMSVARSAFLDECGAALVRKHGNSGDPLFTPCGFREYADDLLKRMVNPYLHDLVERVIRDPRRKLGYDDRLFGTMRLALSQGIEPTRMAQGAAAALLHLASTEPLDLSTHDAVGRVLRGIWNQHVDGHADDHAQRLIDLTWAAMQAVRA
jgi:mannitol-1-phosphate 5-dehydrogenase